MIKAIETIYRFVKDINLLKAKLHMTVGNDDF